MRWLVAVSEHTWQALGIVGTGRIRGTCPVCQGPAGWAQRARLANSSASGHAAAKAMRTRLAPGGAFVVSLPHVGHYSVALPLVLKGRWTYQDEGLLDRTHLRFFDRVSAPALLTENGLTIERLEPVIDTGGLFNVVLFRSSRRLRWYTTRLLQHVLPGNMLEYRFLIRGRVPG